MSPATRRAKKLPKFGSENLFWRQENSEKILPEEIRELWNGNLSW